MFILVMRFGFTWMVINSQNNWMWSSENPQTFTERTLNSCKSVCGVTFPAIVWYEPLFFDTTITAEVYFYLIQQFIVLFERQLVSAGWCNCQHFKWNKWLIFYDSLVSKNLWLTFVDLTLPEFYLWKYLKNVVF